MTVTRRNIVTVLALSGGGALIASGAALGVAAGRAGLIAPDPRPFAPWGALAEARPGDPLALVAAAILAASPHNTQPWRFEVEPGEIRLSADEARNLGRLDPFRREMWIGLGCAVENMVQAGPHFGFEVAPRFEATTTGAMPHVRLVLTRRPPVADRVVGLITRRRCNRAPYAATPVAAQALARLQALGGEGHARVKLFAGDSALGRRFAEATVAATARICADPGMSGDSHAWYRANAAEVARHRDGVSVPTSGLAPLMTFAGQILPAPDAAGEGRYWLASTRRQVDASALFGTIATDDLYDRAQQLDAGRLWQRLQLEMTALGLASQPLNQLPEAADRARQLGQAADVAQASATADGFGDGRVTFGFRAGYPNQDAPHSARRGLAEVVET